MIINLEGYKAVAVYERPSRVYNFRGPQGYRIAKVERLDAGGSDATEGVSVGGVVYDYVLAEGRPVVRNGTEESMELQDGMLTVGVRGVAGSSGQLVLMVGDSLMASENTALTDCYSSSRVLIR